MLLGVDKTEATQGVDMRIGLSDAVSEKPDTHGAGRSNAASQGAVGVAAGFPEDTTAISTTAAAVLGNKDSASAGSNDGPGVANLVQQALTGSAARSARVGELRDAVAAGAYRVEPAQIADAMLRETN
jgi:anti-sigma28 factor (negative regulator of flagellin synthesis)